MNVQVLYTRSQSGLHLLVDSTGISSRVKTSGNAKGMGLSVVGNGASCTLASMLRHCRLVLSV